ncbi:MAG TPA: hypothetical protein VIP77_00170 [Jiangellaceae bacterium]
MIVPIILVAMVVVLMIHGFVLRRRRSSYDHGFFFDLGGSHNHTFVNSMQDFSPAPRGRGFDTKHWNSVYWG